MFNTKWDSDSKHPTCYDCKNKFTTFLRKHHCRKCGKIFCSNCMKKIKIFNAPNIICLKCIDILNNSIFINRHDLDVLKKELVECRQNLLELTTVSNKNIFSSSNIITYNTNSTQTYTIHKDKYIQTINISTNNIGIQTSNISTNEIAIQTDIQTDINSNSNSFTQTNKKTKSLDILECIENVSKKNPIKRISSEENEILKYNKDKLKRQEDELIKKNNDILRKQSEIFNAQKLSLQKQLISLKNQEELLHKKEQELNLRENQLKKLHVNEIIETSHNKANEIRDLCKTKELEDKIKKQNTDMKKLKEQNDSIQKKYKVDLLQKQKNDELKAQREADLLQKQKENELKAQREADLLQKQKNDELKTQHEADLLQKQKTDELKAKQVVKNISTRELVLQRKLEKKKLEEETYKKELQNIHNTYQEDIKNSKKIY